MTQMCTISEEYMQDILGTVKDAIEQRIFLENIVGKYHDTLEELKATRAELEATKESLQAARADLNVESVYAKLFMQHIVKMKTQRARVEVEPKAEPKAPQKIEPKPAPTVLKKRKQEQITI